VSVTSNIDYQTLVTRLSNEYSSPYICIQYEDEEGDLITVRSNSDLEEAFNYINSNKLPVLKLILKSNESINKSRSEMVASSNSSDEPESKKNNDSIKNNEETKKLNLEN